MFDFGTLFKCNSFGTRRCQRGACSQSGESVAGKVRRIKQDTDPGCSNDSWGARARVRYCETYANCLYGAALTDLKAIYASRSAPDLRHCIRRAPIVQLTTQDLPMKGFTIDGKSAGRLLDQACGISRRCCRQVEPVLGCLL